MTPPMQDTVRELMAQAAIVLVSPKFAENIGSAARIAANMGIGQLILVCREMPDREKCDLLSLPDLVQAKKTQRDKDWPMIRRLVEAHYFQNQTKPKSAQIRFWFQELRTPELLVELTRRYPAICRRSVRQRPLLTYAQSGKTTELEHALLAEETAERQRDREYWVPLRRELEKLRHRRKTSAATI